MMEASRELDALVATHAMGWRRIAEGPKGYWEGRSPTNVLSLLHEEVPRYSTDIAAARQVLKAVLAWSGYKQFYFLMALSSHIQVRTKANQPPHDLKLILLMEPEDICKAALEASGVRMLPAEYYEESDDA